jgi:hypothetical protein
MLSKKPIHTIRAGRDDLFGWTIFLLLLAGFAAACWIGSFYIFGHPEKAFSYGVLRTLGKIDPPRRFELTAAPRGQFLDADKLFERYGKMPPRQLENVNETLLRSYLRNYEQHKELVPYVIGPFNIMGSFRLGPNNFFPEGVVALARSTENPAVLLELVFPSSPDNVANLERMLLTGLDLKLVKTLDLTAVINASLSPDGRLTITAVPLLYSNYTSSDSTGTFSLEPPQDLHVSAGLPILNFAAIEEADKHYTAYLERAGLAPKSAASLMRVQQPEAVNPDTTPVARAVPANIPPPQNAPVSLDNVPVARAVPSGGDENVPVARALPVDATDNMPVARAEPVNPAATPLQPLAAAVPVPAASPATIATTAAREWNVYQPGLMPRGRLVDLNAAQTMAGQSSTQGVTYLAGDFQVSASGNNRAVLRGNRGQQNVRVIVDFPTGSTPPPQGENVSRDAQRPFQITSVEQGADGQINVYVREVTRP